MKPATVGPIKPAKDDIERRTPNRMVLLSPPSEAAPMYAKTPVKTLVKLPKPPIKKEAKRIQSTFIVGMSSIKREREIINELITLRLNHLINIK